MQKVLVVTYYWPPAGGAGVQRWLMFTKYLPEHGIQPHVYVPENPSYPNQDATLNQHISRDLTIVKQKIVEPYQLASLLKKNKTVSYQKGQFDSAAKQDILSKILIWVRGNLFIPDARMFWVRPSVKYLQSYIQENNINTIITTGPPHSMHLIGLKLKQQRPNLRWIADFRDPWTQISYHKQLKLSNWAKNKHQGLEQKVFATADLILSTSYTDAANFAQLGATHTQIITNGYDFNKNNYTKENSTNFRMVYAGGLEALRNPLALWKALQQITKESPEFKQQLQLIFYGNISDEVKESLRNFGLMELVTEKGYVPHQQSIQGIINADVLWLTNFDSQASKGIIPGKLFEYLGTENRILSIGPKNADTERILQQTQCGKHFAHQDTKAIKHFIQSEHTNWQTQQSLKANSQAVAQFSRKNLSKKLATILLNPNPRV